MRCARNSDRKTSVSRRAILRFVSYKSRFYVAAACADRWRALTIRRQSVVENFRKIALRMSLGGYAFNRSVKAASRAACLSALLVLNLRILASFH